MKRYEHEKGRAPPPPKPPPQKISLIKCKRKKRKRKKKSIEEHFLPCPFSLPPTGDPFAYHWGDPADS